MGDTNDSAAEAAADREQQSPYSGVSADRAL
jgi:hypothetical protein